MAGERSSNPDEVKDATDCHSLKFSLPAPNKISF